MTSTDDAAPASLPPLARLVEDAFAAMEAAGAERADVMAVVEGFAEWAAASGRPLYAHQEEALLALADDRHVVLATPTGSGKSIAALAGIVLALAEGRRAVWTAPIKALVAEKFFELAQLLGADRVGLAIGDASINRDAPVLVCTAEVLANIALGKGADTPFAFACLDEFHYFGDPDRGWAWQVPLLTMTDCQFLLPSATLGDPTLIADDLARRSGRTVDTITAVTRPTPLFHQWRTTPVAESITAAIEQGLSPVYLVHSTQAAAVEQAQALVSLPLTTRPQREAIAAALTGERLRRGFGATLARLLRNGVGVHHAGMLPRYRRLVERLAGEGLLPVICGTDTLGVGINIPIRTVLLSALTKFDGERVRVLRAREFHQIAGRAGRPGFDPDGHVWAQAPEHVIENERALARAGDDPKARRKVHRVAPPKGFVHYDSATFERLIGAAPEPLVSRFSVSPNLVVTVLSRPDGVEALKELLRTNLDTPERRRRHRRRALAVYRSLEAAGVARRLRDAEGSCQGVEIGARADDGSDTGVSVAPGRHHAPRFTSPLGPFAMEVIATFDREEHAYPLDVVSVVESIVDDPMAILIAQEKAARALEIARLKADGVEYDDRIALIEGVSWPKPLHELLDACMTAYREHHPWVFDAPSPKSIVREMLESGETFGGFVNRYKIERSEGLLLRYVTDVWRVLDGGLAPSAHTPMLDDVVEWLAHMIRTTDASLLEEWERMAALEGAARDGADGVGGVLAGGRDGDDAPLSPFAVAPRAWRTTVRTAAFGWVELLARRAYGVLAERSGASLVALIEAVSPYWDEHAAIETHADARSAEWFSFTDESTDRWEIRQRLCDPEGDGDWGFTATVDLTEARADGAPTLHLVSLGRFGEERPVVASHPSR